MVGPGKQSAQNEIFAAVEKNDSEKLTQLMSAVAGMQISLENPVFSDPRTGASLLHHAVLVSGSVLRFLNVAEYQQTVKLSICDRKQNMISLLK